MKPGFTHTEALVINGCIILLIGLVITLIAYAIS